MKYPNLLFILLLAAALPAQEPVPNPSEKGAAPLASPPPSGGGRGEVRAVIVGISDYQSPQITDLHFAHRDAEVFAEWLQSPAGGNVPADNVQLFTNERASRAAVITALYDLLDVCRPGDQLVFYFSGHGDVETKTRNNPGFLLAHDTPPNVYMAGAINLRDLQDIVGTLSERQVKVLLITDACHAGKLAGSAIGGTQATAYSLQQQFANEVKIMSCQPNEFSLEGEEWGGGRGVFSYHLIDALTGLADKNGDGTVNLLEAGRYLEETVPAATAPHPQMPVTSGDRLATLARVDAASLAALKQSKSGSTTLLSSSGSKGLEDEVLARADSLTRARYHAFKMALKGNKLLENNDSCADAHFRYLIGQEALAPLQGLMRRNFAVALLDEVQQALNALLDNDPYEANTWSYNPQKYNQYPAYLARSIELLGEKHHLARDLRARQLFFEGYNLLKLVGERENDPRRRDSLGKEAKALLLQSFALNEEAAYVPYMIGSLYLFQNTDSVVLWRSKAIERAPGWLTPYLDIAYEVARTSGDFKQAETWVNRALAQDSTSYIAMERLSWLMQWQFRPEEANALCDKMIALKPDLFNAYSTKASTLYWLQGEYPESERYCLRSLELNPDQYSWSFWVLGLNYMETRRAEETVKLYRRVLAGNIPLFDKGWLYPDLIKALVLLGRYTEAEQTLADAVTIGIDDVQNLTALKANAGRMWLQLGDLPRAETVLRDALSIDQTLDNMWIQIHADLGLVYMRLGRYSDAETYFQKAITQEKIWADLPFREEAHFLYGNFLLTRKRIAEARLQFEKCREYRPKGWRWPYGNALLAASEGKTDEALDWLEQALDRYLPRKEPILEEPLFKKLRITKRFKALMARHFPKEE